MDRRFLGVLAATVSAAVATIGAQAPSTAKPPSMTVTGCLQKASSGGYTLASDSKSGATGTSGGAAKGSYSLVGVTPPGLKLTELVNKKLEVVGTVGEPFSKDSNMPTLTMRTVKPVSGSCS
jgi:hypothetical protein